MDNQKGVTIEYITKLENELKDELRGNEYVMGVLWKKNTNDEYYLVIRVNERIPKETMDNLPKEKDGIYISAEIQGPVIFL